MVVFDCTCNTQNSLLRRLILVWLRNSLPSRKAKGPSQLANTEQFVPIHSKVIPLHIFILCNIHYNIIFSSMPLTPKQPNMIKTKLCVDFLLTYVSAAHSLLVVTVIATIHE